MPELALGLLALYFAIAFAGRVLIQLRMTGSTGIAGITGRPGSAEWLGGVLFLVSVVVLPTGVVLHANETIEPIDALDGSFGHSLGIALFALGCSGTFYAQLAMGASWRIGVGEEDRTELVTRGPFGFVRNPIYSAMIPAFSGIVLLSPTWLSLAGLALLVIGIEIQVRLVEEPHLMRSHPGYPKYAARVGRFVPGLGRLRWRG
jgi:protein-S-isoprenylcysteine O-methyltransferase Ste14